MDYGGGDLDCAGGADVGIVRAKCDSTPDCKAFSLKLDGSHCTKKAYTTPLVVNVATCFYSRQVDCPPAPIGYRLTSNSISARDYDGGNP